MMLRQKTLLIFLAVLAGLFLILGGAALRFAQTSLLQMERAEMEQALERVSAILREQMERQNRNTTDYAHWDDTAAFMLDRNPEYLRSNMVDDTFSDLQLNFIALLDEQGTPVFTKMVDLQSQQAVPVPGSIVDGLLARCFGPAAGVAPCPQQGIFPLDGAPMLVTMQAILTSEGEGPVRGTLLMGRTIDQQEITRLAQMSGLNVDIFLAESVLGIPTVRFAGQTNGQVRSRVEVLSSRRLAGYRLLDDLFGQPNLVLRVEVERETYQMGLAVLRWLVGSSMVVALLMSALAFGLLDRVVIARLEHLTAAIRDTGMEGDLARRVAVAGNDELAALGATWNATLFALQQAQERLKDSEARYRAIVEDQTELICRVLPDGSISYVNDAYCRYFAAARESILGSSFTIDMPGEDLAVVGQMFAALTLQQAVVTYEHRVILPNQEQRWMQWTLRAIYRQGQLVEYQLVGRDTTDQKRVEERLRYLSLHDSLTGLYNRAHLENELDQIEQNNAFPVTIVGIDMDGLKSTNDQYGHMAGDALLVAAAELLEQCFRAEDTVVRIGGDEFAVVMPRTGLETAERYVARVRQAADVYCQPDYGLAIAFSIGAATASSAAELADARKEADARMYQDKRARRQATAGASYR